MPNLDINSISSDLKIGENGIWFSSDIEKISYPTDGNEDYYSIEEESFWFRHRNECIISIVNSYPPLNNEAVFDIGGGNGFVALGLQNAGFEVALLEPGQVGTLNAKKRGLENVICATVNSANLSQNSLSAVGLFDVIEHIEDDLSFLKSIYSIVKKEGYLYATVPAHNFLWSDEDVDAGHFRRYTRKSIIKVLESAGFKVEFSTYIFRFLPIPVFLIRTLPSIFGLSKFLRKTSNPKRDHTVSEGFGKRILDWVLQSEIKKLACKKSMSFGGSCLIVAKKPSWNS